MKIYFDQLETHLKNSPNTTIASLSPSFNHLAYSKLSSPHQQKYSILNTDSSYHNQYQNRLSNKSAAHTYTSLLKLNENNQKTLVIQKNSPKKFAHVKTIQQMKAFIEEMDRAELQNQRKYTKKQKHSKTKDFQLSLKDLLQQKTPKKQQSKVKTITDRLYYQSERRTNNNTNACCKRDNCKAILMTEERHQTENVTNFTGQPRRAEQHRNKTRQKFYRSLQGSLEQSMDSSFSTRFLEKSQVHKRLYEDSKIRVVKQQELKKQIYRKENKQLNTFHSSRIETQAKQKYTKNYRGFYQRLGELVTSHHNRSRLYDQLNISPSGRILFQPNQGSYFSQRKQRSRSYSQTYKDLSKKLVLLSTKNIKCSKAKCHRNQQKLIEQLTKSKQKLKLNPKSIEIIHEHEQKFLSQMKTIFYDKKNQKIRINEKKVAKLSEKEFEILFELIIKIENKSDRIRNEKMLEKQISSFYQNLDTAKKQQLRRLQILKACRATEKKASNNRRLKQSDRNLSFGNSERKDKPLSSNSQNRSILSSRLQGGVDYCQKLSEFV